MTKKRKISFLVFSFLTIAFTAFIFSNSLLIAEESAARSGRFLPIIQKVLGVFGLNPSIDDVSFFVRKTAHFLEYFLLSALASGAILSLTEKKPFISLAPVYSLLVAITDEFVMQGMTEGRSAEWRDVLIDLCGALLFAVILIIYKRIKRNR